MMSDSRSGGTPGGTPDQVAPLMAFGEKLMRDERREGLQRFGNALVFL